MKKVHQSGFIIPLAIMLLGIGMIITTALFVRGTIFSSFANTIIKKEKAKMLALSGAQIGISQLADRPKKEEKAEQPKATDGAPKPEAPELLKQLIPVLNRWQYFPLKESVDGIDGEIRLKISCEEGKIPINQLIDFSKQELKGSKDFKESFWPAVSKATGIKDIQKQLLSYVKKEKKPFEEITQLLQVPGFELFNAYQFTQPPNTDPKQKKVVLADLFSIWNATETVSPWLLSDSVIAALQLKEPAPDVRTKDWELWVRTFKSKLAFPGDWKTIFVPIYKKEWDTLPKGIESFFATSFDPKYFSVVSYGKVGDVTQSVNLILERVPQTVKGKTIHQFIIRRAYWL